MTSRSKRGLESWSSYKIDAILSNGSETLIHILNDDEDYYYTILYNEKIYNDWQEMPNNEANKFVKDYCERLIRCLEVYRFRPTNRDLSRARRLFCFDFLRKVIELDLLPTG